jgi:hypothetical protein
LAIRTSEVRILRLKACRPQIPDVLRKAIFFIRRQVFRELCEQGDSAKALHYLRTELSSVVNHNSEEESSSFRKLTSWLFGWNDSIDTVIQSPDMPGTRQTSYL